MASTSKTYGFLAPAVGMSIAITIFAVVTECLDATGAISLSTTQQLTTWLVSAGLIVLLWIAYMTCQAYVTARAEKTEAEQARDEATEATEKLNGALARAAAEQEANTAQVTSARQAAEKAETEAKQARDQATEATEKLNEALARAAVKQQQAPEGPNPTGGSGPFVHRQEKDGNAGEDQDAWTPPPEHRHLDGSKHHVRTEEVFPAGCYLERDSISPASAPDKLTGDPVYQCGVVDPNLALEDHATVVNIDQKPVTAGWPQCALVEFDDLQVIPYETDRSAIRYTLRATGVHLADQAVRERGLQTSKLMIRSCAGARAPIQLEPIGTPVPRAANAVGLYGPPGFKSPILRHPGSRAAISSRAGLRPRPPAAATAILLSANAFP